jgi:hypothetical protein
MNPRSLSSPQNKDVFEKLQTLVGEWSGTTPSGRVLRVKYSLHAKKSVLMESWTLSESVDALTLYHNDGNILMAQHYCPLCNQVRLDFMGYSDENTLEFVFCSATNLPDLSMAHQHSFQIRYIDENTFWRSETYRSNGKDESEAVTYHRLQGER